MIDQISNLGVAAVAPPAAITSSAGSGSLDLLGQQAQGMIGFILDAVLSTASSTSVTTKIQSSPDNSTWTDVTGGGFTAVSDTAGAGIQFLVIGSEVIGRYVRAYDTVSGSASVIRSITAVFKVKNK